MAIALVGSAGALASSTTNSVSPAFAQATTAGNVQVAVVGAMSSTNSFTTNTITTSQTNWFAVSGTVNFSNSNSQANSTSIWYRFTTGNGNAAPVFTCASATSMAALLLEFSGTNAPSDPQDRAGKSGNGTAASVTLSSADSNASDVCVGIETSVFTKSCTVGGPSSVWSPSGGTATDIANNYGTKQAWHVDVAMYFLNGNGGGTADNWQKNAVTEAPSTGAYANVSLSLFSLKPAPPPPPIPVVPNIISCAVARAASY